ncbi:MAG: alpha/beta fold hydrolase [Nevskiaceae bacterium]|nr:MAG: alpha/beta fold hydrolase [Nevskiaceae bacterium]TBR72659.1 MAG: alpha/beta fold hydrolase [Nevskiaceae bacterium]
MKPSTQIVADMGRNLVPRSKTLHVARVVLRQLARRPGVPAHHAVAFAGEWLKILRGQSDLMPEKGDRRFNDTSWVHGRFNKAVMQTYLAAAREAYALTNELELEGRDATSARFLALSLIAALSPSNNPLINPVVRDAIRKTRGKNLAQGLYHMLGDQLNNRGLITMVDATPFEVGRNVACTPGQVVFRNELLELIQYQPTTAEVYARPILVVPPQINKFYVMDLSPDNSLARYLVGQGFQTFMVSWRNPTAQLQACGFAHYCDALEEAHAAVMEITGSDSVNWKGLCAGGITSTLALARYAKQKKLASVNSLTLAVTLLDLGEIRKTNLGYFLDPEALEKRRAQVRKDGILDSGSLAKMFAWIRPNDLVWNYWVNNYLLGKKPPAFDVLYWNSDATRLPAQLFMDFTDLAGRNPFSRGEPMALGKLQINPHDIDIDKFIVGGRTDHITPWQGCYRSVHILGGKSEFVLVNSGHIQTLVAAPGKHRATYQIGTANPATAEAWDAASTEVTGSWWEHWSPWLAVRSGDKKRAPRALGSRKHKQLCAAPGTYVHG